MLPHEPTEKILHASWGLQLFHARYPGLCRCLASTSRAPENTSHDMMQLRLVLAP